MLACLSLLWQRALSAHSAAELVLAVCSVFSRLVLVVAFYFISTISIINIASSFVVNLHAVSCFNNLAGIKQPSIDLHDLQLHVSTASACNMDIDSGKPALMIGHDHELSLIHI